MFKTRTKSHVLRTTPWRRRTGDGVYFGHNGSVWSYFEWPLMPLQWEDAPVRLGKGQALEHALTELGELSVDLGSGMSSLAMRRSIHVFAATFDRAQPLPETTGEAHERFLEQVLPVVTPAKTVLIGVKLWPQLMRNLVRGGAGGGSLIAQAKAVLTRSSDSGDSFDAYVQDYAEISDILRRAGARVPSERALKQLESWFNYGNGPDAQVLVGARELHVTGGGSWEIAAVSKMTRPVLPAPQAQWLLDAMAHNDPAVAVSVRAELTPASILQAQLRQSQRKMRAAAEEEAATGDVTRDEIAERADFAKDLENNVRSSQQAWLTSASVLMARVHDPFRESHSSYLDTLRSVHGIEAKPLEQRQLEALDEMQPCSSTTANPFHQVLNPAFLAYSGLPAFSEIGEPGNLWIGRVDPDYPSAFISYDGAPRRNLPPGMGIFGDPGSGKASALSAKVLTPSGWTTMGEIRVGDELVARDGSTQRVVGAYPQGVVPIYRVTFNDGSSTEVTGDHLWAVSTSGRIAKGRPWQVRTTAELQKSLLDGQGKRQWRIPLASAVERADAPLPVDPYLLGVLIGDGGLTAYVGLSTADAEIVERVQQLIPEGTYLRHKGGHDYQVVRRAPHGPNPLGDQLRDLGLMGKTSLHKFIPRPYLWGSVAQRFSLLQGLLDTDGTAATSGTPIFYTSSRQLADDVCELVQGLGGTARLTEKSPAYRHRGVLRSGARSYRVTICLPNHLGAPFQLERKRCRWKARSRYEPSRSIAEIRYVRDDEAQCIAVSSPDRLYVTDDYIVTHNTFTAQLIAGQAALSGTQTIMINPKGFDSLRSFADWVSEYGVPSRVVSLSALEHQAGAFDPFRFTEPQNAAEILVSHINAVLGSNYNGGLTGHQELLLGEGIYRGAMSGARCAYEALQYVEDADVVKLVLAQATASSLFRLGFGYEPQPRFTSAEAGLTLVEFDNDLRLPEPGKPHASYERAERLAVAAMRLITRASMEILMGAGGGVLVVDEAHHYLGTSEGLASLQRIGREGRSLGLLPIFVTQRVSDLLDKDMENYLSRVLVMKLTDAEQARAALTLCGLEPTEERVKFLREAGPRAPSNGVPGRAPLGIFRDLEDRHSVISIGPIPEDIRLAFSTNPDDRRKRAQLRAEQQPASAPTSEEPQ